MVAMMDSEEKEQGDEEEEEAPPKRTAMEIEHEEFLEKLSGYSDAVLYINPMRHSMMLFAVNQRMGEGGAGCMQVNLCIHVCNTVTPGKANHARPVCYAVRGGALCFAVKVQQSKPCQARMLYCKGWRTLLCRESATKQTMPDPYVMP